MSRLLSYVCLNHTKQYKLKNHSFQPSLLCIWKSFIKPMLKIALNYMKILLLMHKTNYAIPLPHFSYVLKIYVCYPQ